MSWSITSKGKAEDVAHEILQSDYVPDSIKALVADCAKHLDHDELNGLEVQTHGHIGLGSVNATVTISYFKLPLRKPQPHKTDTRSPADPAVMKEKLQ